MHRRLHVRAQPVTVHKIDLYLDYASDIKMREAPDPYYGGPNGFEQVFDMVEAAADGLLADIRRRLDD